MRTEKQNEIEKSKQQIMEVEEENEWIRGYIAGLEFALWEMKRK